jgi:hypothetical protein
MPKITVEKTGQGVTMGSQLIDLGRCPHCSISKPNMLRVWGTPLQTQRTDGGPPTWWAAYHCAACGGITVAKGKPAGEEFLGLQFFPAPKVGTRRYPRNGPQISSTSLRHLTCP